MVFCTKHCPGDYLVVHEKAVKGRYDKLADERSEFLGLLLRSLN